MGRAYSQDLRERVMAAVDSGTGAYAGVHLPGQRVLYLQSSRAADEDGRDERASLGRRPVCSTGRWMGASFLTYVEHFLAPKHARANAENFLRRSAAACFLPNDLIRRGFLLLSSGSEVRRISQIK
jgi:hypothetical protein